MAKPKTHQISAKMYELLAKSASRIEASLAVLEKEEKEGKEGKGGVNFLGQQLYQLSIAYAALRKEERDSAKSPLASDQLSPEDMKELLLETLTTEELREMLELKEQREGASNDSSEETNDTGQQ